MPNLNPQEDQVQDLFRVIILGLGVVYFFLVGALPNWFGTVVLKYVLVLLGAFYIIYKLLNIKNQSEKVIYIVSVILAFILIISFNHLFSLGACSLDDPCPANQFCATDHLCHDFPEYTNKVTKTTLNKNVDFTVGGLIIGMGLILSSAILRKNSFYRKSLKLVKKKLKKLMIK